MTGPGRADHRELRSPRLSAGANGVAPQVASTRVPVPLTVYYEADPFILRSAGRAPIHSVAPADHPVAVPEKYGSTGNELPKTRFLAKTSGMETHV